MSDQGVGNNRGRALISLPDGSSKLFYGDTEEEISAQASNYWNTRQIKNPAAARAAAAAVPKSPVKAAAKAAGKAPVADPGEPDLAAKVAAYRLKYFNNTLGNIRHNLTGDLGGLSPTERIAYRLAKDPHDKAAQIQGMALSHVGRIALKQRIGEIRDLNRPGTVEIGPGGVPYKKYADERPLTPAEQKIADDHYDKNEPFQMQREPAPPREIHDAVQSLLMGPEGARQLNQPKEGVGEQFKQSATQFATGLLDPESLAFMFGGGAVAKAGGPLASRLLAYGFGGMAGKSAFEKFQSGNVGGGIFDTLLGAGVIGGHALLEKKPQRQPPPPRPTTVEFPEPPGIGGPPKPKPPSGLGAGPEPGPAPGTPGNPFTTPPPPEHPEVIRFNDHISTDPRIKETADIVAAQKRLAELTAKNKRTQAEKIEAGKLAQTVEDHIRGIQNFAERYKAATGRDIGLNTDADTWTDFSRRAGRTKILDKARQALRTGDTTFDKLFPETVKPSPAATPPRPAPDPETPTTASATPASETPSVELSKEHQSLVLDLEDLHTATKAKASNYVSTTSGTARKADPNSFATYTDINVRRAVAKMEKIKSLQTAIRSGTATQAQVDESKKLVSPKRKWQLRPEFAAVTPVPESEGGAGTSVPGVDLAPHIEAARDRLEAYINPEPASGKTELSALEKLGADTTAAKLAFSKFVGVKKTAFPSAEKYTEARQDAWENFVQTLGVIDSHAPSSKAASPASGGDEEVASFARVRGKPDRVYMGNTDDGATVLRSNLYKGDIGKVTLKETIQNSVDAIRSKGADGKITVEMVSYGKTLRIVDNGHGMLPDIVTGAFVDIGGTYKEEGSSGGLGIAKVAILRNAEHFKLVTTARRPDGKYVQTTLEGAGDDLGDKKKGVNISSIVLPGSAETGSKLELKFYPETTTSGYASLNWARDFARLHNLEGDIRVNVDGMEYRPDNVDREEYTEVATLTPAGADVTMRVSAKTRRQSYVYVSVLNRGLPQFEMAVPIGSNVELPVNIIADVSTRVKPRHPDYPFSADREGLKDAVSDAIKQYVAGKMKQDSVKGSIDKYKKVLTGGPVLGTRASGKNQPRLIDTMEHVPPELIAKIAANRTVNAVSDAAYRVYKEMESVLSAYDPTYSIGRFAGIAIFPDDADGRVLGVNYSAKAIFPDSDEKNPIVFDPFNMFSGIAGMVKSGVLPKDDMPGYLAKQIASTLLHEMTHNVARSEGADFTHPFTENVGRTFPYLVKWGSVIKHALGDSGIYEIGHINNQLSPYRDGTNILKPVSSDHSALPGRIAENPEGGAVERSEGPQTTVSSQNNDRSGVSSRRFSALEENEKTEGTERVEPASKESLAPLNDDASTLSSGDDVVTPPHRTKTFRRSPKNAGFMDLGPLPPKGGSGPVGRLLHHGPEVLNAANKADAARVSAPLRAELMAQDLYKGMTDLQKDALGEWIVGNRLNWGAMGEADPVKKARKEAHPQYMTDAELDQMRAVPIIGDALERLRDKHKPIIDRMSVDAGVAINDAAAQSPYYMRLVPSNVMEDQDINRAAFRSRGGSGERRARPKATRARKQAKFSANEYSTDVGAILQIVLRDVEEKSAVNNFWRILRDEGLVAVPPRGARGWTKPEGYSPVEVQGKFDRGPVDLERLYGEHAVVYVPTDVAQTLHEMNAPSWGESDRRVEAMKRLSRLLISVTLGLNVPAVPWHIYRQTAMFRASTALADAKRNPATVLPNAIPFVGTVVKGAVIASRNADDPIYKDIYQHLVEINAISPRSMEGLTGNLGRLPLAERWSAMLHDSMFGVPHGKGFNGWAGRIAVEAYLARTRFEGSDSPERDRAYIGQFGTYMRRISPYLDAFAEANPFFRTHVSRIFTSLQLAVGKTGLETPRRPGESETTFRMREALDRIGSFAMAVAVPVVGFVLLNRLMSGKWPWENGKGNELSLNLGHGHYIPVGRLLTELGPMVEMSGLSSRMHREKTAPVVGYKPSRFGSMRSSNISAPASTNPVKDSLGDTLIGAANIATGMFDSPMLTSGMALVNKRAYWQYQQRTKGPELMAMSPSTATDAQKALNTVTAIVGANSVVPTLGYADDAQWSIGKSVMDYLTQDAVKQDYQHKKNIKPKKFGRMR